MVPFLSKMNHRLEMLRRHILRMHAPREEREFHPLGSCILIRPEARDPGWKTYGNCLLFNTTSEKVLSQMGYARDTGVSWKGIK